MRRTTLYTRAVYKNLRLDLGIYKLRTRVSLRINFTQPAHQLFSHLEIRRYYNIYRARLFISPRQIAYWQQRARASLTHEKNVNKKFFFFRKFICIKKKQKALSVKSCWCCLCKSLIQFQKRDESCFLLYIVLYTVTKKKYQIKLELLINKIVTVKHFSKLF